MENGPRRQPPQPERVLRLLRADQTWARSSSPRPSSTCADVRRTRSRYSDTSPPAASPRRNGRSGSSSGSFLPVIVLFYGTGLVLYAFYKVHGDPLAAGLIQKEDQILPYFVVTQLPAGLPGLLIAAIYAASMSTISAGLNSLSSATVVDFQQRLTKQTGPPDSREVSRARWITVAYGLLVMVLAFAVSEMPGNLVESVNTVIASSGARCWGSFSSACSRSGPTPAEPSPDALWASSPSSRSTSTRSALHRGEAGATGLLHLVQPLRGSDHGGRGFARLGRSPHPRPGTRPLKHPRGRD